MVTEGVCENCWGAYGGLLGDGGGDGVSGEGVREEKKMWLSLRWERAMRGGVQHG